MSTTCFPLKRSGRQRLTQGTRKLIHFYTLLNSRGLALLTDLIIFFNYSTRIKIPINKLKRDVYDADKKSAAQAAIDAEVARRRERNLGFEDVTDVCGWLFFLAHSFISFVYL
jgi:hypothetical protein